MTKITFEQESPKGTREIDTKNLFVGSDGEIYLRSPANNSMVKISSEVEAALSARFGKTRVNQARTAVGSLS